jgi:hypothetical protein
MAKCIRIKVAKVLPQCYKVLTVEALDQKGLPREYLMAAPYCYLDLAVNSLVIWDGSGYWSLILGDTYTVQDFHKLLDIVRACAARLRKINDNWFGEEIFEI